MQPNAITLSGNKVKLIYQEAWEMLLHITISVEKPAGNGKLSPLLPVTL